jgi:hypothetical protein
VLARCAGVLADPDSANRGRGWSFRDYGLTPTSVSGLPVEVTDEFRGVQPDCMCEFEKLHDIDPAFSAFDSGNVGLPPPKAVSQNGLRQFGVLPRFRQQLAQLCVLAREERLRHAPWSKSVTDYSKTDYYWRLSTPMDRSLRVEY